MLDLDRIAAIARSYDTTMARAFRRALGIERGDRARLTRREARRREREAYRGVRECFENRSRARTDV